MQTIYVYHNNGTKRPVTEVDESVSHIWETCQRQIVISSCPQPLKPYFQEFTDQNAFAFLLEVILGQHSKLFGESEVLGQFKNRFLINQALLTSWDYQSSGLYKYLAKEAKRIRTAHLKNNGETTYGGLIKKYIIHSDAIDIIGNGHIVQEIIPWLACSSVSYRCFNRNTEKAKSDLESLVQRSNIALEYLSVDSESSFLDILIIGAPIDASSLSEKKLKNVKQVIDLRDSSEIDPINHQNIITLEQLFTLKSNNLAHIKEKRLQINFEVEISSKKWFYKPVYRPLGWEDTCLYA